MKILIVNDDSISAPGIAMLAEVASSFGDVWVVAPAEECSAMSQKLTLRETLLLEKVENFPVDVSAAYRLSGTPVDCVKVALEYLMTDKPDWVFSGINNGYNAGYDIAYSGTVGAAFEAVRNGIPAIAFSIASNSHLEAAKPLLHGVIQELLEADLEANTLWNVNFPQLCTKPLAGVLRDRAVAPTSMFREEYVPELHGDTGVMLSCKGRPTPNDQIPAGTDVHAVRNGYISIGKVR